MNIYNDGYTWMPPKDLYYHTLKPLPVKVKGSTLGWYIKRTWVSYNQLKEAAELFKKNKLYKQSQALGTPLPRRGSGGEDKLPS
jgi:hypothetical protein